MSNIVGPSYFYEDEVFRINKSGDVEFGMVTENWDMYSSDDEDEEASNPEKVPHGCVAVTWLPKSKDEVIQESKVQLSDRSLMPGDVVRRLIAGKDTQRGYCRSVRVSADVQILGSKKVIMGVPATSLLPVQKLQSEIAVYLDSWIGVVRDVKYLLHLVFADGSTCVADSLSLGDNFDDVRKNSEVYSNSDVFYPGQKLRGRMKHLKDADFSNIGHDVKRAKDRKLVTVTVTNVQPTSLDVQWQWQTPSQTKQENTATDLKPPSDTVTGEDIKRVKCLNLFESCTVQLSDMSFYTPSPKDTLIDKSDWKKKVLNSATANPQSGIKETELSGATNDKDQIVEIVGSAEENDDLVSDENADEGNNKKCGVTESVVDKVSTTTKKVMPKVSTRSLRKKKLKKAARQQPAPKLESEGQTVVETLHTQSVVDVVWQDGSYEEGMRSVDLYPIHHLDDHEFFPGDFVVLADSNDFKKYGVIQQMDHCGRVASVKWFEAYSFSGEQKPKDLEESEMSVYDIKDHPDFRYRPGTIVIRVANMNDQLCPAGQIMDNYPDGKVRVWWANGDISPCWPQDLFRLGEYDSDEGEIWDDDNDGQRHSDSEEGQEDEDEKGANSDSSWETETEEEQHDTDSTERYQHIGQLIERIQKTLVSTREAIVAQSSVSVSVSEDNLAGVASPIAVSKLGGFNERGLTKKLLLIYKDCQYLDKIMGTKFFDVEDLKRWHKDNESTTVKSGRMMEQISRLFDVPRNDTEESSLTPVVEDKESSHAILPTSQSSSIVESSDDFNNPGMVLYELCSIILKKLVEAHSEYEKRFGGFKNEHISANQFLCDAKKGIEALAECLGKQYLKRHLNKPGCSRLHHEITYRVVQSTIDDLCNNSPTGKTTESVPKTESELTATLDIVPSSELVNGGGDLSAGTVSNAVDTANSAENCLSTIVPAVTEESANFNIIDSVPDIHRYRLTSFLPQNQRQFIKTIQKEVALLRETLPDGICVKGFEDRMDLYSVMIKGPEKTPYEDGLFLFDINLPTAYPSVPPLVHYIAFCTDRLNPNLYEEGKVCVSLLGTWNGKGTEVWTSSSSLLQLLVSIQGLILVPEPYYNEAGYEKQKSTQQGSENSRMYNENVLIKLVQSMSRMIANPPAPWEKEIIQHMKIHGPRLIERYTSWLDMSGTSQGMDEDMEPSFPLLPVSKGFKITLTKTIAAFGKLLTSI